MSAGGFAADVITVELGSRHFNTYGRRSELSLRAR